MGRRCSVRVGFAEKARAKLESERGETLVETLVSTLIMSAVMLMLCTAIVTAAKATAAIDVHDTSVNVAATESAEEPQEMSGWKVAVKHSDGTTDVATASVYSQNGYVYYEPASTD